MKNLAPLLKKAKQTVEAALPAFLEPPNFPERAGFQKPGFSPLEQTYEAMRYMVFLGDGGKRIRPALTLSAYELCSGRTDVEATHPEYGCFASALDCAAGIELIHTYTLVVDDIVDKSDLRRGDPTCHVKFGVETAAFAAGMLYERGLRPFHRVPQYFLPDSSTEIVGFLLDQVHRGQTADTNSVAWPSDLRTLQNLQFIHSGKTSALIQLSLLGGALCAHASDAQKEALLKYGYFVGLAFQARDDVLSIIGDPKVLGKPTGPEADAGKLTYVSLFGSADAAQTQAEQLAEEAVNSLEGKFQNPTGVLEDLARYAVQREK